MVNSQTVCSQPGESDNDPSLTDAMAPYPRSGSVHFLANRLPTAHKDGAPASPQNTPITASGSAARSTVTTAPSIGEQIVNPVTVHLETLQRDEPGRFWEQDTIAPNNTPVSTTHLHPRTHGLPSIEETIQNLPEARSGPHSSSSVYSVDGTSKTGKAQSLGSVGVDGQAARSMIAVTTRAPPPTATTGITTPENVGSIEEGVFEFTDWEQEVEDLLQTALARLAQLAVDKAKKDPSKTAEEYYRGKLNKILSKPMLPFTFGNIDTSSAPLPSTAVEASVTADTPTIAESRIRDLEVKVDKLMKVMENMFKASAGQGVYGKPHEL